MTVKLARRIIGAFVFLLSTVILFLTVQPSVSFWDPGEISAASYSMMVPHPPGGPLWLIIGRFFSMIPFASNIGFRINTVSVLAGSFTILVLYLVIIKLIESYRGKNYQNTSDAVITYISALIGALAFAFCDTFWFNAVESNYFSLSTLLFSLVVWLMMIWNDHANESGSEKYIILMAYLIGLSFGVHLMSVLAVFTFVLVIVMKKYVTDDEAYKKTAYIFLIHLGIMLVVAIGLWSSQTGTTPPTPEQYKAFDSKFVWIMIGISALYVGALWKKIFHRDSFYIPLIIAGVILLLAYPGIVKGFPGLLLALGGSGIATNIIIFLAILGIVLYVIYWSAKNKRSLINLASTALLFTLLGFTTYSMIIIRSNQNPPMNENWPNNFQKLMYYLDREQYGDFPIFERRFSAEPHQQGIYTNYSSDLDFFWRYQMDHMFNRYLYWNYIGKTSTVQDSPSTWKQLYGIPFLVGLIGLYFLFKKDWKMASAWLILFIFMGYLIAFYQNQQQPQPRDRFYFYPGALFVYAVWIGIGMREIVELIREKLKKKNIAKAAVFAALGLGVLFIPGNMLRTNYFTHDRSKNWLPWDFSYNLLQSCKPNAILFTNGDNDTFPLWYLQDVEGVRRDIRVVCLSLANTDWYNEQLKNTSPYGAEKVKFSMTDDMIKQLSPIEWKTQIVNIPVTKDAVKNFSITDKSIMSSIDTSTLSNSEMSFRMNPTIEIGGIKGIRIQDIVVKDIVENNLWDRPIYFASTCSPDCFIGMDDYLEMEGLASRVVPVKRKGPVYVNTKITEADLFNEDPSYSKTYKTGFKFRGINNKNIFYDETETRLIQNYRNTFINLAYYYKNVDNNNAMCIKTLDMMGKEIPRSVVDMDYRILYDVANIYYSCGAMDRFKELAHDIEPIALQNLNISMEDLQSPYNSFSMLERIYVNLKEYDKAIGILQKLQNMMPNAGGVTQEIDRLKQMEQAEQKSIDTTKK
ncbi:MAG: DUF2723 domain-containing protein [Bacteroidetes bacterium]|nr:DUF2723 domain-containing protein [Bacteroidota bacterium]